MRLVGRQHLNPEWLAQQQNNPSHRPQSVRPNESVAGTVQ